MARRRSPLIPADATSEGSRRLRELLARQTFAAIALRLRCDEAAVRFYARESRKPNNDMRNRIAEVLLIAFEAWDQPPSNDAYVGDPVTTRRS